MKVSLVLDLDLEVETTGLDGQEREDDDMISGIEFDVVSEISEHLMYEPGSLEPTDLVQQIRDIGIRVTAQEFLDLPATP